MKRGVKMAKRMRTGPVLTGSRASQLEVGSIGPDELKNVVRDKLTTMTAERRQEFILDLERELRAANLSIRAYLIPIGVSALSLEELTPGDVGHLVRYLKFNVPGAKNAINSLVERLGSDRITDAKVGDRLAA